MAGAIAEIDTGLWISPHNYPSTALMQKWAIASVHDGHTAVASPSISLTRCQSHYAIRIIQHTLAFQHRHRGIVSADTRHRAAAAGRRPAHQDSVMLRGNPPAPRRSVERLVVLGERPLSAPWKMLPAVMPSVFSRSTVVLASIHGRPDESSIDTS